MAATPFEGQAPYSVAKAIYDHPENVAPADRLYAADTANDYDPADYADQPGAAARANGYPRA